MPLACARFLASDVRAKIIARSNWTNAPSTARINRPCGDVVSSIGSASDLNPQLRCNRHQHVTLSGRGSIRTNGFKCWLPVATYRAPCCTCGALWVPVILTRQCPIDEFQEPQQLFVIARPRVCPLQFMCIGSLGVTSSLSSWDECLPPHADHVS